MAQQWQGSILLGACYLAIARNSISLWSNGSGQHSNGEARQCLDLRSKGKAKETRCIVPRCPEQQKHCKEEYRIAEEKRRAS